MDGVKDVPKVRPRRILYVHHASALGGASVSLLLSIQTLDRTRYQPKVALIRPVPALHEFFEKAGIPTIDVGGIDTFEHSTARWSDLANPLTWPSFILQVLRGISSIIHARQLLRTAKPDLVHLNSVVLLWVALALIRDHRRVIWHVREHPVRGLFGLRRALQRIALRRCASQVLFLSEAERQAWLPNGGGNASVLRNLMTMGLRSAVEDRNRLRGLLQIEPRQPVLLYTGGLLPIKGIDTLLNALVIVRRSHPEVRCLMPGTLIHDLLPPSKVRSLSIRLLGHVGIRGQRDRFQRRMDSLGVTDVCVVRPFQTQMEPWFAAADVVVFPALESHFPRPIVEAGLMEKPVIASDLTGIREEVRHGETGLLVPPSDAQAFAQAVLRLLERPDDALRMGREARQLHRRDGNVAHHATVLMAIYEGVTARLANDPGAVEHFTGAAV